MSIMPIFDTWEASDSPGVPEDMKKQYPVGAKLEGGAAGVVVGYEMKVLYNWKPAWFVVVMFEDGKLSPFERTWMKGNKVQKIIKFNTADELVEEAMKTWHKE